MRLLHARAGRGHPRPAHANAAADRYGDPRGSGWQHLPLHRLRKDHRRGAPGRPSDVAMSARVGESPRRPDGPPKVRGEFEYSSDLKADRMLWGATVRSPHPHARIVSIDPSAALALEGVQAVLAHEDVPGRKVYGLEIQDQPVLAIDVVRYWGESVALVAADSPEHARRAAKLVRVEYQVLEPLTDPELALTEAAPRLHPDGNVTRYVKIRHGDQRAEADVVVRGEYEVGMQDQAPLGPESGLAIPNSDGGIDLHIATQWLHVDRDHGKLIYEHGATRDGKLVYLKARILLDGGAYASSSTAVIANACSFAAGPYEVPKATIDGWVVYTNNPPCGAMRGFGSVQNCYAHEAQMDRLAAALGMDPVELRIRNAMKT